MRPVLVLSGAQKEIQEARRHYLEIDKQLAIDLQDEIDRLLQLIKKSPYVGSPYRGVYRKVLLHRFPYKLFYYLTDRAIKVTAFAHHKRRPDYWIDRTP